MRHRILASVLAACSLGCASLAVQPDDSAAMKSAKILTRIPLGIATVAVSEIVIDRSAAEAEDRRYVESVRHAMANLRVRALAAESEEERRALLSVHDAFASELRDHLERQDAANARAAAALLLMQQAQPPPASFQPQRIRCHSSIIGNQVITSCR